MLIALGHEAQVGKDTFAMFLVNHLRRLNWKGLKITREGFADRLYDLAYATYRWAGFQSRQFYQENPKQKEVILPLVGKTPRDILIGLGNIAREFDPGIWLNAVVKDRGHHLKIIPDLRKLNEFEYCEANEVYRIKIMIPGRPPSTFQSDVDLQPIPTERWSEIILNDGDLSCLNAKAVDFAERVVIPRIQKYMHGEIKL